MGRYAQYAQHVMLSGQEEVEEAVEYDGLQLHLNKQSPTGYTGVSREGSRYRVRHGGTHIGTFATAVEAAAAGFFTSMLARSEGGLRRGGRRGP